MDVYKRLILSLSLICLSMGACETSSGSGMSNHAKWILGKMETAPKPLPSPDISAWAPPVVSRPADPGIPKPDLDPCPQTFRDELQSRRISRDNYYKQLQDPDLTDSDKVYIRDRITKADKGIQDLLRSYKNKGYNCE